jgi:membrane associated rhomboid family serine protease
MSSGGPDLFVVCKSCGAEVSPYITECPYCGNRLRKRAPRIEREGGEPKLQLPRRPKLPKLRPGEIPGIAPDVTRRPYATIFLVAVAVVFLPVFAVLAPHYFLTVEVGHDPWKLLIQPFLHDNGWYAFVALFAVAIFGTLVERRDGPLAVLLLFVLGGSGGIAVAVATAPDTIVLGANGAALALLCAWAVPPLLAHRSGHGDPDDDLIGAFVYGLVLIAISFVIPEADPVTAAVGLVVGFLGGLLLSAVHARR